MNPGALSHYSYALSDALRDFRGKKVLQAFYVADWSPVCGPEMICFKDDIGDLQKHNVSVLGISVDSTWSHKAWAQDMDIDFPILSDFNRETSRKYGLLRAEGFSERAYLLIDDGVVKWKHVMANPAEKLDNSYATGDFVTWGISSPERLLRHAGKVKRRELEGTLDYHGEHYQVGPGTPWRKAGQLLYEATHEVVSRPMLPMAALVGAEAGLLIGAHWKVLEYIANVGALPPEAKLGAAVAIGASALGLTFLSAYKTMIEVIAAAEPLGRMKMRFEQWSRHAAGAGALSVASDETL